MTQHPGGSHRHRSGTPTVRVGSIPNHLPDLGMPMPLNCPSIGGHGHAKFLYTPCLYIFYSGELWILDVCMYSHILFRRIMDLRCVQPKYNQINPNSHGQAQQKLEFVLGLVSQTQSLNSKSYLEYGSGLVLGIRDPILSRLWYLPGETL